MIRLSIITIAYAVFAASILHYFGTSIYYDQSLFLLKIFVILGSAALFLSRELQLALKISVKEKRYILLLALILPLGLQFLGENVIENVASLGSSRI